MRTSISRLCRRIIATQKRRPKYLYILLLLYTLKICVLGLAFGVLSKWNVFNNYFSSSEKSEILNSSVKNLTYIKLKTDDKLQKFHNTKNRSYDFIKRNFILKSDNNTYFKENSYGLICYSQGIKKDKDMHNPKSCPCLKGYYGTDCGIPESVYYSKPKYIYKNFKRRRKPRRIIHGFPVHHEFDMFEARINELYDVVDVFILAESNYTAHRDPKKLEFFDKLLKGYMKKFHDKLLYIKLGYLYKYGNESGWMADQFIRYYLGKRGLTMIQNEDDDDLFILTDADEIPSREVITFLKLYEGYPEPIGFSYKWNVFGFFWQYPADSDFFNWISGEKEKSSIVYSVASIKMIRLMYKDNVFLIRKENSWKSQTLQDGLIKFRKSGGEVMGWVIGNTEYYAGWHCSWCLRPNDIVRKMDAAQSEDKPRWGDYPQKKSIKYIQTRIKNGIWFDEKLKFLPCNSTRKHYAPKYFEENYIRYNYLLSNPYLSQSNKSNNLTLRLTLP